MRDVTLVENMRGADAERLCRIEPEDRVVVLARAIDAREAEAEFALKEKAVSWTSRGDTCIGQALYRRRSIFRNASDAPAWSHLELSYFRESIPADVVREFVFARDPQGASLLRAEILLTTPSSFILPRDWRGTPTSPERHASLEYIEVRPQFLAEYRNVMRTLIGPAAAKLVHANAIGTFRSMETAAVLYRNSALTVDWNQIHLCEVKAHGFDGFGPELDAALKEMAPDGGFAEVFAGLDRMRTVRRWTFDDPVVEADAALCHVNAAKAMNGGRPTA